MRNISKIIVTAVLVVTSLLTAAAAQRPRGVGCWRSVPKRHAAASRMLAPQEASAARLRYTGTRRGLVILAEFTDTKFKANNNRERYINIFNAEGYHTKEGFRGSVKDYFRDQSAGQFDLVFDVVGPYKTSRPYKYYGENDLDGYDKHPEEMVVEMCRAADGEVNFKDYDWNGDGEADEVFVVYAGKGEADGGGVNTIWPHMWTLKDAGTSLRLDGVRIETYACSNELQAVGGITGIGNFCHEFAHCLGLPDFYDITYSGAFGMGSFDLMCEGNYGGNGFCPVGFTAYEKMVCGWQEPIVLSTADVDVDSLKAMSDNGDSYIIYNEANRDEFIMIENRQMTGWDTHYPAKGLLITHVDYDSEVWDANIPNSILTLDEAKQLELSVGNDHQRMTLYHADDDDDSRYWRKTYYSRTTLATDLYPYQMNDSLTGTSKPAAQFFHSDATGNNLLQGAITNIRENDDGTMAFSYRAPRQVVGISEAGSPTPRLHRIYTLDGRCVGTNWDALAPGLYIVDGRKRIK
jgi:M6 family metalloprotease-like protein